LALPDRRFGLHRVPAGVGVDERRSVGDFCQAVAADLDIDRLTCKSEADVLVQTVATTYFRQRLVVGSG
jgi:hypothetical protein